MINCMRIRNETIFSKWDGEVEEGEGEGRSDGYHASSQSQA